MVEQPQTSWNELVVVPSESPTKAGKLRQAILANVQVPNVERQVPRFLTLINEFQPISGSVWPAYL